MAALECALCGNRLTMGGKSGAYKAARDPVLLEDFAVILGWFVRADDRWVCQRHDAAPSCPSPTIPQKDKSE